MPIFQRKERNGEWWIDVRIEGRRIRRRAPVQSPEGALEFETATRQRAAQGADPDLVPLSSRSAFAQFSEVWMTNYVMVANKHSTIREKRGTLKKRLLPAFGHLALDQITTNTVDAQVASWMRGGLGLKRINNILTVLRKALRCAEEWGFLSKAPMIRHHTYYPPVPQFLTRTESDRLLAVMDPGFWKTFVQLLLTTGLRFGEAAALKWEDLELATDRPYITVKRSVSYGIVSETKTRQSRRTVALIPETAAALRTLRMERPNTSWVFTTRTGRLPHSGKSVVVLKRACIKAGVPVVSWHKLRHSCATQLMAEGVPLIAIKEVLGHTNIDVTAIYTHVVPSSMWQYMNVLSPSRTGDQIPLPQMAA